MVWAQFQLVRFQQTTIKFLSKCKKNLVKIFFFNKTFESNFETYPQSEIEITESYKKGKGC
jgi:hypothetical protein